MEYIANKIFTFGKWNIRYSHRSKNNFWGRFGGGWNWKLGIQIGGSTIIMSLLIAEITIWKLNVKT